MLPTIFITDDIYTSFCPGTATSAAYPTYTTKWNPAASGNSFSVINSGGLPSLQQQPRVQPPTGQVLVEIPSKIDETIGIFIFC